MEFRKEITEMQGINFTSKKFWKKEILLDYIASDMERKEAKYIIQSKEKKKTNIIERDR